MNIHIYINKYIYILDIYYLGVTTLNYLRLKTTWNNCNIFVLADFLRNK